MIARILLVLAALLATPICLADEAPACRIDHTYEPVVKNTAERAVSQYKALGKDIKVDRVIVNPAKPPVDARTMAVYVITSAASDAVAPNGCASRKIRKGEAVDRISVRGGCFVKSAISPAIMCSAEAVKIFAFAGEKTDRIGPGLLYVLAHEIGHIYQRREGEYSGRVIQLRLATDPATKLEQLRDRCTPTMTEREEQADEYALDVLRRSLSNSPYREPVFSEQGSLFWNIDLLALAADRWALESTEREFMSQAPMHEAFEPTQFPTPPDQIARTAKNFVCEVMTKKKGAVSVPAVSGTHPPAEQRLRRIAEVLRPAALKLPKSGGSQQYEPLAALQQDLGPIFTHIYRETGVYMTALEAQICTLANAPDPLTACKQ